MTSEGRPVGRVGAVWRYPVKSMQGEMLEESEVAETGLVGDRAFALYDVETGKVASAKSPRLWPSLLGFSASFVERPFAGRPLPPVRIETPAGEAFVTTGPNIDARLSQAVDRKVRLVSSAPPGTTYEQYVPPVEGADVEGMIPAVVCPASERADGVRPMIGDFKRSDRHLDVDHVLCGQPRH